MKKTFAVAAMLSVLAAPAAFARDVNEGAYDLYPAFAAVQAKLERDAAGHNAFASVATSRPSAFKPGSSAERWWFDRATMNIGAW